MNFKLVSEISSLAMVATLASTGLSWADGPSLPPVDIITPAPVPPAPTAANWAGFYGGVSIGRARGTVEWEDEIGGFYAAQGDDFENDLEDTAGGLQFGYNWQTPSNVVFGVEVSGLFLDMDETETSPFFPASDELSASIRNPLAITGHVGVARGRWHPYIEAGVASAEIGMKNEDTNFGEVFDSEERQTGYVAGVGVGYKVSNRSAVGVNYRHFDFGNATHDGSTSPGGIPESYDVNANLGVFSVFWNFYLNGS